MTRRLFLTLSLLATGCYDQEDALGATDLADTASGFDATLEGLRIDVFPGSNLADGNLPAQSFRDIGADGAWDLNLPLREPILVHGGLTGIDANPTADIGVPGEDVRVLGTFKAFVPGTPMSVSIDTDEDGEVRDVQLVPSADYTIAWVPQQPSELPFYISTGEVLEQDTDLSVALDYGLPLFGQVAVAGAPLQGALVQAVDVETGIGGPIVEVDHDGRYMLRVYPGQYELRVTHSTGAHIPTQVLPIAVWDAEGTEQDVEYSTLDTHRVDGVVRNADSVPMADVLVRFTAVEVYGASAGRLTYEATSDGNGNYLARLVPGRYSVEYVPSRGSAWGPRVSTELDLREETGLAPVVLDARPVVKASVVDPTGAPVAGATVRARELGFDNDTFEAVTDETGGFEMALSDTTFAWTFVPPAEISAAIGHGEGTPDVIDGGTINLHEGQLITGHVSFNGDPAAYTLIDVRDSEERLYGSALTDGEGNFEVRVDPASVSR